MAIKRTTALMLLFAFVAAFSAGCASTSTGGGEVPDDPRLIHNELEEIRNDISNTEEWIKGSKSELQIEDSQDLRNEIRRLEMELYELRSREKALEERLLELEAAGIE